MNAASGGVSAGGLGTPLFDVTHSGGGPSAFVASHPIGNAGGVTLSKFSSTCTDKEHAGQVLALSICPVAGATTAPTAMSRTKAMTFREDHVADVRFRCRVIAPRVQAKIYLNARTTVNLFRQSLRATMVKSVYGFPR
jgi:hypothetical protein